MATYYISKQKNILYQSIKAATKEDLLKWLQNKEVVGLDLETSGLNFLNDIILLLIIGDDKDQFVINAVDTNISFLTPVLEDNSITKILHTAHFDYKFLKNSGITLENIWDIALVEKVLNTGKSNIRYSLKNMVSYYLPNEEMSKTVRISFINKRDSYFTENQILYGSKDIAYLPVIRKMQYSKISKYKLWNVIKLENASTLAFADMEYNGFKLDTEKWKSLYDIALKKVNHLEKELDEMVLSDEKFAFLNQGYQLDLFNNDVRKISLNWNSPKQILNILKIFDSSVESTGDEVLERLSKYPLIQKLIEYKMYQKKIGAFGVKFFDLLYSDGKIHTEFERIQRTGRVSSKNPNMQQIPAEKEYRACFIPSTKDSVLVSADYSSQELALIAWDSQDPVWLNALKEGEDLHSVCAELVYKDKWKNGTEPDCNFYKEIAEPQSDGTIIIKKAKKKCSCKIHKSLRTSVKTINFGLAYGGGPPMIASRLKISVEEATQLIEEYFKTFPKIHDYFESVAQYGLTHGKMITMNPFNRIRFFPNWDKYQMDESVKGDISRKSKNTRIQGSGADMTKYALVLMRRTINDNNLPVKLIMQIHDEIITETSAEFAPVWKEKFQELMEQAAKVIVKNGLLKADASIKYKWEK